MGVSSEVLWIAFAPSLVVVLAGLVGYVWREMDKRSATNILHQAQLKATEMDETIRRQLDALRISHDLHVQNVNNMHLQNTQSMAKFPSREEVQGTVDRGVHQILSALEKVKP